MTSAIIVQIKNENKYLDEWITYNQNLGINHIYMIDNNDIDGEDPHDIINKYGEYITYINDRGNINENNHKKNYVDTYNKYSNNYNWFLFIDPDEFITLIEDININVYLSRDIFNNVDQIFINWTIYDDNDLIYYEDTPVLTRFTRRMNTDYNKEYPLYNLHKPFLKGGLHINNIDDHRFHNIVNYENEFVSVDDIGNYINQEAGSNNHDETLCYIKHYMTKSLEEFIDKKFNKYDGNHMCKYDFDLGYFTINNHTDKKDAYIKDYLNKINSDIKIGIFYIATGIYKNHFNQFYSSIENLFPNNKKLLIIISDGLNEYDNIIKDNLEIHVEYIINYPYPFININKFQIIYEYAKKYNIEYISYFDSETYILKNNNDLYDSFINLMNDNKFIISYAPHTHDIDMNKFMHIIDNDTEFGELAGYEDFKFLNKEISKNYQWLITSFWMCNIDMLKNISNKLYDLILYNNRHMHYSFNFSDELYINYLYQNCNDQYNIYADYYIKNNIENIEIFDYVNINNIFIKQKYLTDNDKNKLKTGNIDNKNINVYLLNINNDVYYEKQANKYFINNFNKVNICLYGNMISSNSKRYKNNILLYDSWFNENSNILIEKSFYKHILNVEYDNIDVYCFINNDIINFDYNKFYDEKYDYIEGYSFDDIKNIKFNNIDICCFSKRYIISYINNNLNFNPKIYKIN